MIKTVSASEFYERVYDTRRDSAAAEELFEMVNELMDEVGCAGLLGKVDSCKDDRSEEVATHYFLCLRA